MAEIFLPKASLSNSFGMLSSENIFFGRRFSSSIAFVGETIEASIPPYLARHLMGWTALPPIWQTVPIPDQKESRYED